MHKTPESPNLCISYSLPGGSQAVLETYYWILCKLTFIRENGRLTGGQAGWHHAPGVVNRNSTSQVL